VHSCRFFTSTLGLAKAAFVVASLALTSAGRGQEGTASAKASGSFAEASDATRDLRRSLLEERWNYSKENRAAAEREYAAIRASGEATAADDLLYGVVQFRQHDYAPSAASLTTALATMPEDRLTLKTRIWTAVERDELAVVWPLLSRLQRVVFARSKDPAVSAEALRDDLVFLGQLHGYLAGPYGELDNARLLSSHRDDAAAGLPLSALSVFEAAERSVGDRYDAVSDELQRLIAEDEKALQAEAEARLAELHAQREDLQEDKSKIDPVRAKLADASRETLGALTQAEALAASSVETAQRQAEALRTEYFGVVDNLQVLYALRRDWERNGPGPEESRDIGAQLVFQDRIALAWRAMNALEAQMDALQRDHAQLNFNFQQIRQQRAMREAELQRNAAKLAWDEAKIERELQLLDRQMQGIVDPKRRRSLEVREKERALTSVSTYVDFSLEVPRDAALAALGRR
jgi:uncharacterized protein YoxC